MPAPPASTSGIAVSYQRKDAGAAAKRLVQDLSAVFGARRIHVDFASMSPGEDIRESLARSLAASRVLLVLIGPHWLQLANDWVRAEVATALQLGLVVVPVLLDGATMPPAGALPDDLRDLATRHAAMLSSDRWRSDMQQLTAMLATLDAQDTPPPSMTDSLRDGLRALFGARAAPPAPAPDLAPAPSPAPPPPPPAALPPTPPQRTPAVAGKDIFISYAFEDEAWAQRVVQALEPLGYACWVASRDIVPGTPSYAREITRAIRTSRLFIVLLSAASNASDDVLNEITLAKDHQVPRLPLRIDDAPLGDGMLYFFSQAQRLEGGGLGQAAVLSRLAASVQRQLGAPG